MGVPNSWMVYVRENPTKMDDNWGYPHDLGTPHILQGISLTIALKKHAFFLWNRYLRPQSVPGACPLIYGTSLEQRHENLYIAGFEKMGKVFFGYMG